MDKDGPRTTSMRTKQRRTWQDRFDAVEVAADNELPVTESPFSYQKFSPKNFQLPFKHMYEALNVIK